MAIFFACGWEMGHRDAWGATYTKPANTAVDGAYAHTGAYGMGILSPAGANTLLLALPSTPATVYLSVWVRFFSGTTNRFGVRLGDGKDIDFRRDADGYLDLYIDGVKAADGGLVAAAGWVHFEAYIFSDDVGQVCTRINGYNDIDYSGDTKPGASAAITSFLGYCSGGNVLYFDDLVMDGADWLGDVRIEGIVPNAAGDDSDWLLSPDTGEAGWEDTDDVPPDDDTTYVHTGADAQDDLYELADWTAAGNVPLAVVQYARGKKMSVDATAFKFLAKEGGATTVSGNKTLTTAYKYFQEVLTAKPSGGAWDDAAIDDLQAGQRSVI